MTLEMNTEKEEKMAKNEVCLVSKRKKAHEGVREEFITETGEVGLYRIRLRTEFQENGSKQQ